jgi:hypothetical protein
LVRASREQATIGPAFMLGLTRLFRERRIDAVGMAETSRVSRLTAEDLRGLTPLTFGHVNPCSRFELGMEKRPPWGYAEQPPRLRLLTASVSLPLKASSLGGCAGLARSVRCPAPHIGGAGAE